MAELRFMLIAGEVSGDQRAAALITSLRKQPELTGSSFFGAGGTAMRDAGMELLIDLTGHAVIGHLEAIKNYFKFKGFFNQLLDSAVERRPDVLVLIDYSGFNLRFAKALKERAAGIEDWNPKIVYYVSPQLWASREGRSATMAANVDLLLSIIPFEKKWYEERLPGFPVKFIGHPLLDEFEEQPPVFTKPDTLTQAPHVLLLPGSRKAEVSRHLPLLLETARRLGTDRKMRFTMIIPSDDLLEYCKANGADSEGITLQKGSTREALETADLAITKSGTITLECALYGVPSIVFYITNPLIYFLGRRLIKVPYLAMPNLIAGKEVFPEFIQGEASAANLTQAADQLLNDQEMRSQTINDLRKVVESLGAKGGTQRAANAIGRELKLIP